MRTRAAALLVTAACAACNSASTTGPEAQRSMVFEHDIHSFARPEEARVTDVALDLRVDFDAKRLSGRATLTLERSPGCGEALAE